jgi:16S rRNA (cytosine967-C5)-methyltransferase
VDEVTEPRRVALEVLRRVRAGELVDRALARAAEGLTPRDQAWVQELVYGTQRWLGRLDHYLANFVRSGLDSLEPDVLDILRLGAYQLLEMGSVPPYAAVSQSVELARAAGVGRAAGLVNGVLQSLRRRKDTVRFPGFDEDPAGHLTTWGSHPRWLIDRWIARWGPDDTRHLVDANNRRPELFLRPIGVSVEEAVTRLAVAGIAAESVEGFPDSVVLHPPHRVVDALAAVPAVVQDPAAAMVVRYADIPRGSAVVDLSAAPGGKAVGLALAARYVVAADPSFDRLRRVRSNVERTGVADRVGIVAADGRMPPFRPVDAVLLDVPCSGTGTFRRHVDGRWRLSGRDLEALTTLQRELLAAAATLVKPGGVLVYATCSLEPEENEMQAERFLARAPDFRLAAPSTPMRGTMLRQGYLNVLPQRHGVDGAFAARFERLA